MTAHGKYAVRVRDPERVDRVTTLLFRYWRRHPDLRLGQIVGNVASRAAIDPYYIEDDEIEFYLADRLRDA